MMLIATMEPTVAPAMMDDLVVVCASTNGLLIVVWLEGLLVLVDALLALVDGLIEIWDDVPFEDGLMRRISSNDTTGGNLRT